MKCFSKHNPPCSGEVLPLVVREHLTFHVLLASASWRSFQMQEVEKEVWEKDALGKQRLKRVQETEYCYEADMEGACARASAPREHFPVCPST